jgi:hypothetical protein
LYSNFNYNNGGGAKFNGGFDNETNSTVTNINYEHNINYYDNNNKVVIKR